jgi:L-amino acid N-acyltransferase YncA
VRCKEIPHARASSGPRRCHDDREGTFETRLRTSAEIEQWFDGVHPSAVREVDHEVVAFASTSRYRDRTCYAGIAAFSLYVRRAWRGQGAGRLVLEALVQRGEQADFWTLVSRVNIENVARRRLLRALGFREVGVYEKHGQLDGVWRDVVIVQRLFLHNLRLPLMRPDQTGSPHYWASLAVRPFWPRHVFLSKAHRDLLEQSARKLLLLVSHSRRNASKAESTTHEIGPVQKR